MVPGRRAARGCGRLEEEKAESEAEKNQGTESTWSRFLAIWGGVEGSGSADGVENHLDKLTSNWSRL